MPLRTAEQYLESLRDGRTVYYRGERVADVTTHAELGIGARHCAIDYALADDPHHRDLVRVTEAGQTVNRFYKIPRNADDLLRRRELIAGTTYAGRAIIQLIREIGTDFLFAHAIISHALQEKLKAPYYERLQAYHRHVADNDLAMAVAQTDVKGDRSRGPREQEHPDYYLRIVDRQKDGIVIRGCKAHTTSSIYANEIIAIPTRALGDGDTDYAVAVAVPASTRGLRFIVSPLSGGGGSAFHAPISSRHKIYDTLTVFDDVFVPSERVFLCGETPYAGALALGFVEFHRFTAVSYKLPLMDLMIGAAMLMAEANGIETASHVREKLSRLISYRETVRSLTVAAAHECKVKGPGVAVPDTTITNIAKQYFAENYHAMVQRVQDIAGGLLVTGPGEEDLANPETKADVEKYLGGRKGVGAHNRLKLFNLIRDLMASDFGGYHELLAIHAEGSLEAQKITILRGFDAAACRAFAAECAGLELSA
ncbi:MAG: gamma-aminobutyrate dehydratase [Candidatus Rokubacteria bacterium]|nr:gamma-aminobutyrate dehydratase [Candidatus Rokubacteria bacterium]